MSNGFAMDQMIMANQGVMEPPGFAPGGRGGGSSDDAFASFLDSAMDQRASKQHADTGMQARVETRAEVNIQQPHREAALSRADSAAMDMLEEILQALLGEGAPDSEGMDNLIEKLELLEKALPLFNDEQLEQLQELLSEMDGDWSALQEKLALFLEKAAVKDSSGEKVELFLDQTVSKDLQQLKGKINELKEAQAAKEEKIAALKEAKEAKNAKEVKNDELKQQQRLAQMAKESELNEEKLNQKLKELKEAHQSNQKKLNQLLEKLQAKTQKQSSENNWRLSAEAREKLSQQTNMESTKEFTKESTKESTKEITKESIKGISKEATANNSEERTALRELLAKTRKAGENATEGTQKAAENSRSRQDLQQILTSAKDSSKGGDKFSRLAEMMRALGSNTGDQLFSLEGKAQDAMLNRAEMRTIQQQQPLQDSIMDQLKGRLAYFKGTESFPAEMRMTLRPPALGEVMVRVFQQKDRLTAAIVAERASVKDILENNLNDLRQRFQQMNLNVERVEVYTSAEEFSGSDFQRDFLFQEGQDGYRRGGKMAPESPPTAELPSEIEGKEEKEPGGVDLRA